MNKVLFFLSFLIFNSGLAQFERFVYTDSLNTSGVSPVSSEKIKEQKIRRIELYTIGSKDSFHTKTFLYDTSGNLIKEILHGRNKAVIGFIDSIVYNTDNKRSKEFAKTPFQGTISESFFEYFGDTLIHSTFYTVMENKIDTVYSVRFFNEKKQLLKYSSTNATGNRSLETNYSYNESGLIKSVEYRDLINPDYTYGYSYEHRFSKKGRTIKLKPTHTSGKNINTECTYNSSYECIECIRYEYPQPDIHSFTYKNGLLFEHIHKFYNPYNKKSVSIRSRYYYYQ